MIEKIICIGWIVLTTTCYASETSVVTHPNNDFAGIDTVIFAQNTVLKIIERPEIQIVLESYSGSWKNGLAHGMGTLNGLYVIPSSDNPTYKHLQSEDADTKGQALAIIERVRQEAEFKNMDSNEAVRAFLGEKVISVKYQGAFEIGAATGEGELSTSAHKLNGTFYKWLPEGLATHSFGNFPVLLETFSKGIPSDGPVIINQYVGGSLSPSRIFVGKVKESKFSGDWYEQEWHIKSDFYSIIGLGDTTKYNFNNGESATCIYNSLWLKKPSATDLNFIRGDANNYPLQGSDQMYLNYPTVCTAVSSTGWSYSYNIVGTSLFNVNHAPPYSCADPQGRAGTYSHSSDGFSICTVTIISETKYKWGTKLLKDIEHGVNKLKDKFFTKVNKVTNESIIPHICGIAQKKPEPGGGCNINMSYGITFDIPDTAEKQRQRAQEDLSTFLEAQKKLNENSSSQSKEQWESAVEIYNACAKSCVGPAQKFSMLSVQEIQNILSSGFEDDIKRYRLASWSGGAWSLFKSGAERAWSLFGSPPKFWSMVNNYIPVAEVVAGAYSGYQVLKVIEDAQFYLHKIEPTDYISMTWSSKTGHSS